MTARATFTQAELARAIRAAEACGKVAVLNTGHALKVPVKVLDGAGSGRVRTYFWGDINDDAVVYVREGQGG